MPIQNQLGGKMTPKIDQKPIQQPKPPTAQQVIQSVPEPTTTNWYKGETPTLAETYAQIYRLNQTDPVKAQSLYSEVQAKRYDPSSMFYDPYSQATNSAIQELSGLGYDMSKGINQQWFDENAWLKSYYRTGVGGTPLSPTKTSTAEENAAYWYYQALNAETTTQKAEAEAAALKEEIAYWANRADRNYSDEEILNKINWKNYPTLVEMDADKRKGTPTKLNRAVDYNRDALIGWIWAARNDGGTGSLLDDAAYALMGEGNGWKEDPVARYKRKPGSPTYSPYSLGSSKALDEAALYFGRADFDAQWLADNIGIMDGNDAAAKKYYSEVYAAEQTTLDAETELANLWAEVDKDITKYRMTPTDIINELQGKYNSDYKTLGKLDESMRSGKLVATTRKIDYRWQDVEAEVKRRCEEAKSKPGVGTYTKKVGETVGGKMGLGTETDAAIQTARDEAIAKAGIIIKGAGTKEEGIVFSTAYNYDFDKYVADIQESVTAGQMNPMKGYLFVQDAANEMAKRGYFDAANGLQPYNDLQAKVEDLEKQEAQIAKEYEARFAPLAQINAWKYTHNGQDPLAPKTTIDVDGAQYEVSAELNPKTGKYYISGIQPVGQEIHSQYLAQMTAMSVKPAAEEWLSTLPDFSQYVIPGEGIPMPTEEERKKADQEYANVRKQLGDARLELKDYEQSDAYKNAKARMDGIYKEQEVASEMAALAGKQVVGQNNTLAVLSYLYESGGKWEPTDYNNVYSLYDTALASGISYNVVANYAAQGKKAYEDAIENLDYAIDYANKNGIQMDSSMLNNLQRRREWYQQQIEQADWFSATQQKDYNEVVEKTRKEILDEANKPLPFGVVSAIPQKNIDMAEGGRYGAVDVDKHADEYLYILGKYGQDAADRYFNYLEEGTNLNIRKRVTELSSQATESSLLAAIGMNVLASITAPLELIPSAATFGSGLFGVNLSANDPVFTITNFRNAVKQTSEQAIHDTFEDNPAGEWFAKLGYELSTSMAENLVNATAFTGFGEGINGLLGKAVQAAPMAFEVAGSAYQNALFEGASREQALAMSAASVFSEWISETIEVEDTRDAIRKALKKDIGEEAAVRTIKQIFMDAGFDAINEGIGEAFSEISETALTELIKANMLGLDPEEHDDEWWAKTLGDIGYAALLGAMSGGLMELGGATIGGNFRQAMDIESIAKQRGVSPTVVANEINGRIKQTQRTLQTVPTAPQNPNIAIAEDNNLAPVLQENGVAPTDTLAEVRAKLQEAKAREQQMQQQQNWENENPVDAPLGDEASQKMGDARKKATIEQRQLEGTIESLNRLLESNPVDAIASDEATEALGNVRKQAQNQLEGELEAIKRWQESNPVDNTANDEASQALGEARKKAVIAQRQIEGALEAIARWQESNPVESVEGDSETEALGDNRKNARIAQKEIENALEAIRLWQESNPVNAVAGDEGLLEVSRPEQKRIENDQNRKDVGGDNLKQEQLERQAEQKKQEAEQAKAEWQELQEAKAELERTQRELQQALEAKQQKSQEIIQQNQKKAEESKKNDKVSGDDDAVDLATQRAKAAQEKARKLLDDLKKKQAKSQEIIQRNQREAANPVDAVAGDLGAEELADERAKPKETEVTEVTEETPKTIAEKHRETKAEYEAAVAELEAYLSSKEEEWRALDEEFKRLQEEEYNAKKSQFTVPKVTPPTIDETLDAIDDMEASGVPLDTPIGDVIKKIQNTPFERVISKAGDEGLLSKQVAALTDSLEADTASQTVSLAGVLSGMQEAGTMLWHQATAAAQHAADKFGGSKAVSLLRDILIKAAQTNQDNEQARTAFTIASLGEGEASTVLEDMANGEVTPEGVQNLMTAAEADMGNQELMANMAQAIMDNRVAEKLRDLTADGALKVLDKLKEDVAGAKQKLKESMDAWKTEREKQAAMTEQLNELTEEQQQNAVNTDVVGRINKVLAAIKAQAQVVAQRAADAKQAQEEQENAQKKLDEEQKNALTPLREQAKTLVNEEVLAEQQKRQAEEEQRKQEEQQRMEQEQANQETGNIATMNADSFLKSVLGDNATPEDRKRVLKMFRDTMNEFTADAIQRRNTFVNQVAQKFGINIQFGNGGEGVTTGTGNGYWDADTNTIVLDENATVGDAMYAVLGHELTHVAEQSGTYGELATALLQLKYGKSVGKYRDFIEGVTNGTIRNRAAMDVLGKQSLYNQRLGKNVSTEYAAQEVIADIMGKDVLSGNQDAINRLVAQDRNIAQRIMDTIKSFLRKLTGAEGQWKNNIQRIVDMLDTALKEHAERTAGDQKQVEYEDENRSDQLTQDKAETREATPLVKNSSGDTLADELPGGTVAKHSLSSWTEAEKTRVRADLIAKGYSKNEVDAWVNEVDGVASIIAADRTRLDFDVTDPEKSMVKPNADYGASIDASTLCAKRLLYQGTFDAIQHLLPNTPLMPDDLIHLANMMREMGYEVPCGICYVESRRRNLDKFADEWLQSYKGDYVPTLDEVTTSDGLETLRKNHRQTYDDFIKAMKDLNQRNPKVVQLRTEYRGEIAKMTANAVQKAINHGGLRLQSFSDFETPHLLDMVQVVMDMASKGLTSQAYTKVPNFAWVFGDTGIKINLSLIGKGKGVDANGNLAFDDVEGMPFEEAMRLRNRYGKNVGTILVGINDAHILAAMADDRIDFIIPFHRSGWTKNDLRLMPVIAEYTDYTLTQNERDINTGKKVDKNLEPVGEEGYWDFSKSGKENAEKYLQLCKEKGLIPKFDQFLVNNGDGSYSLQPDGSTDGYWKTLIDFKMYDNNGVGSPQTAVTPNVNMAEAQRVLGDYKLERVQPGAAPVPMKDNNSLPVAQPVVDRYVEEYKEKHPNRKYSLPVVAPVQSSDENIWQPGHSEAWFRENGFPIYQDVPLDQQEINRDTSKKGHGTQIASTESTYRKLFDRIKKENPDTWKDMRVLDASSGLGLGTKAGRDMGFQVTDIEPFPNDTYGPDYTDYEELLRQVRTGKTEPFDFIISNAVLNVIPQDTRDNLVVAMGNLLKPGGSMFVNVISKDYEGARNSNPDLATSLANRKGSARTMEGDYSRSGNANGRGHETFVWGSNSVQKVFSVPELIGYLKDAFGDGYSFKRDNIGMTGVLVTKDANANHNYRYSLQDEEYMQALEAGDADWQAMLVDRAAYEAGYVTGAYHGSPVDDITEFNTRSQEDKKQRMQLLFGTHFTQDRSYADLYARKAKTSKGTSRMTTKYGRVYNAKLDLGKSLDLQTARNYPEGTEMFKLYSDLPANIKRKVPARTFSEYDMQEGLGSGQYVTASIIEQALQAMSPKDATDFLVAHGYNSVKYLADYSTGMANNRMTRDPSIIMLDPERIKSSDPVTYDDQGNVIPLSQRFNRKSNDIRYSLPSDDTLQAMIRQYIANGGMLSEQDVFPGLIGRRDREPVQSRRQFGAQTAPSTDALDEQVLDYLAVNGFYDTDSNKAQVQRAIQWVHNHATQADPSGYYGAVREVLSPDFNYFSADGQAQILTVMSMAAKSGDIAAETELANAYNQQGTNIAQALQARRIFRLMTPEGRRNTLIQMQEDINGWFEDEGRDTRIYLPEDLLEEAENAQTEEDFAKVQRKANKYIGENTPPNWKDRLRAFRYFAMLFNPVTHIRNFLGNAAFMPLVGAKNKLGALGELTLPERTKTLGLADKDARAFAKKDAMAMKDELTGQAKYNDETQQERAKKPFGDSWFQKLIDFNSNLLEAEDWVFLQRHYRNALAGWMTANKVTSADFASNPELLSQARAYAVQEAQKATYRDASKSASMLSDIVRKGGPLGLIVESAIPFKKTPINIMKRGLEYSPLGLAETITRGSVRLARYINWVNNGMKGKQPEKSITPQQYIDRLASGLTGSGIAALGAFLVAHGLLKVKLGKDDEIEKQNGRQNYSFNIELFGHDISYTVDWLAPSSMPLFVGASVFNAISKDTDMEDAMDVAERVVDAFLEITEPVFNLSMLDGINSLLTTYSRNDAAGNTITDIGETLVSNYVTSFMPTILGKLAKTIDRTRRETYYETGAGTTERFFGGIWQKILAKTPGASFLLKPYVSPLGETEESSLVGAILQNFISPGYFKEVDISEMEQEMQRLFEVTGEQTAIPKQPSKYFTVGGEQLNLNAEQYAQLQQVRGSIAKDLLEHVVNSDEYQAYGDDARIKMVKDAWTYATQTAKQQIEPDASMDKWVSEAQRNPINALVNRREEAAKDEYYQQNKAGLFSSIDNNDLAAAQACVEGMRQCGKTNGTIKSAVTKEYKPQYVKAYKEEDEDTVLNIASMLLQLGLGYRTSDFSQWILDDARKETEEDD